MSIFSNVLCLWSFLLCSLLRNKSVLKSLSDTLLSLQLGHRNCLHDTCMSTLQHFSCSTVASQRIGRAVDHLSLMSASCIQHKGTFPIALRSTGQVLMLKRQVWRCCGTSNQSKGKVKYFTFHQIHTYPCSSASISAIQEQSAGVITYPSQPFLHDVACWRSQF